MPAPARAALLLAIACAAAGCSQTGTGSLAGSGRGPLFYAGPAGWELQVLQQGYPYGLAQYVEPRAPGIPEGARGFLLVGKGQVVAGRDPLADACDEQWHSEMESAQPPEDRRPYRLEAAASGAGASKARAGRFAGWEARRRLPDGTIMRLRTLCGVEGTESTYLYLSAPDQSRLFEPTWSRLVELNLGEWAIGPKD